MTDEFSIRFGGGGINSRLSEHVGDALRKAFELSTKLPASVLDMQGMSGRKYRMFINNLISSLRDPRYLEVGSWAGSTACSAIFGNRATITCIDNWSEFGGPKETFLNNIKDALLDDAAFNFIEKDFRAVDFYSIGKYNVYLFDGPHGYQDQFDGIVAASPALDQEFVLIVDDWNWPDVRNGTMDGLASAGTRVLRWVEIRTTQDDTHADAAGPLQRTDWHNGYLIAVASRSPAR
jgi:hypothetical protein